MNSLLPRPAVEIAPGAVHVPDWLTREQQRDLVTACRGWAAGPAPMRHTQLPNRSTMSVQTVCLGWHWYPYRYSRTRDDQDGSPVTPFPGWLVALGRRAVSDAYADPARAAAYTPDVALINHYACDARMGMHRDSDERALDPVVSLSLGVACVFRLGNAAGRGRPWVDIPVQSGDLVVFGDESRLAHPSAPSMPPTMANGCSPRGRSSVPRRRRRWSWRSRSGR